MKRKFKVVVEKDADGYFVASVSELRGCHTQAKSLEVVVERIKEAAALCMEAEGHGSDEFVSV
jgi:predicted RNase H-like HicB family nuclease